MRKGDMRLGLAAILLVALLSAATAQTPPASGGAADPALIDDLVTAGRILADQGVLDAYGHVSIRHPGNPNRYLLARAMAPAIVTAIDIMEYDLDSNPVDRRDRGMFLERSIHGEIYKARPDVNAIVHSHSPAVIPFGVTQVTMKPVFHTAAFLHVGVPVWDISADAGVTDMLVRTATLGKSLAKTLADKPVVLMRGHGNVVVGSTVKRAVIRAVYTEVNARLQTTALGLGGPIRYISPEEGAARDRAPGEEARTWDMWKLKVTGK
jgi:ribulose-5-phosphate 4-epimerase/fuculose-1-phosphate aldolase